MLMKELNKEELNEISWALINISQDIRFAITFKMKDHKTLMDHLTETHKAIDKLDGIILDGKLLEIRKVAEIITDNMFKTNDEYSEEQMEEIEASVTLDDYGRNRFDVEEIDE